MVLYTILIVIYSYLYYHCPLLQLENASLEAPCNCFEGEVANILRQLNNEMFMAGRLAQLLRGSQQLPNHLFFFFFSYDIAARYVLNTGSRRHNPGVGCVPLSIVISIFFTHTLSECHIYTLRRSVSLTPPPYPN